MYSEMNCEQVNILINKELDGRLNAAEREALLQHMEQCPDCAAEYAAYQRLDALLIQQIGAVEPPAELLRAVMSALPEHPVIPMKPRRHIARWLAVGAVAAALLAATAFSGLFAPEEEAPLAPVAPIAEQEQPEQSIPPVQPPVVAQDPTVPDPVQPDPIEPPAEVDPPESDPEQPPQQVAPPPQTYNNGVPLPPVASGSITSGEYELYTLASYEEYHALLPRISENIVTYYVDADGVYLEYQVLLDGSAEPVFVGETESLPLPSGIAGFIDESAAFGFNSLSALSPDGKTVAVNQGGPEPGLYLLTVEEAAARAEKAKAEAVVEEIEEIEETGEIDESIDNEEPLPAGPVPLDIHGGGNLLAWAPDGNKVLFSDADGALHLHYLAENITLTLYDSATAAACWAPDSQTVVFSALDFTGFNSIFRVSVP